MTTPMTAATMPKAGMPRGAVKIVVVATETAKAILAVTGVIETSPFWTSLYHYAWFISFGVSFLVYALLTFESRNGRTLNQMQSGYADQM